MNKVEIKNQIDAATTKMELYGIAGFLNNQPEHIHADKVTFMAFLSIDESKKHCEKMLQGVK